jgi:hypothetical protein
MGMGDAASLEDVDDDTTSKPFFASPGSLMIDMVVVVVSQVMGVESQLLWV